MRIIALFILSIFILACAKVSVEASKPIKVDISMRLDVYQHVENDVNSIVDRIYEGKPKQVNWFLGIGSVYAADFSPQVEAAIARSQMRLTQIEDYLAKGYIGENRDGMLVVLSDENADVMQTVTQENDDRLVIYKNTADENGADLATVRKAFFDKHYQKAPQGASFEVCSSSGCVWKKK